MPKKWWINILLILFVALFWSDVISGISCASAFATRKFPSGFKLIWELPHSYLVAWCGNGSFLLLSCFGFLITIAIFDPALSGGMCAASDRKKVMFIMESLREMEQNRRNFLRRLDHEIKNPLTGLRASWSTCRRPKQG